MSDYDDAAAHRRNSDPDTSHAAAEAAGSKRQLGIAARLYRAFADAYPFGLTADEAARRAGFTRADGAWKRCSDLKRQRAVYDTGQRRPGESGRDQAVLRLVVKGDIWAHMDVRA